MGSASSKNVNATPATDESAAHDRRGSASPRLMRLTSKTNINLNLVSMIDVVFLLFMYFLLTANFTLAEEVYAVNVPHGVPAGAQDPFDLPDSPLEILVMTTGPGPEDYAVRIDLPNLAPTPSFDDLYRRLWDHQVRAGNPTSLFMADNPIRIRPTKNTRWEHAVGALNACLRARYTNVQMVEAGG